MRNLKACRACLSTSGKLERFDDKSRRMFSTVTDLTVFEGDQFPQYLCVECNTYIKKILTFRRKSRRAHFVLKEILLKNKEVTIEEIYKVDRRKTNLLSSLNIWDPKHTFLYSNCIPIEKTEDSNEEHSLNFDYKVRFDKTKKNYNLQIAPLKPVNEKLPEPKIVPKFEKETLKFNKKVLLIDILPLEDNGGVIETEDVQIEKEDPLGGVDEDDDSVGGQNDYLDVPSTKDTDMDKQGSKDESSSRFEHNHIDHEPKHEELRALLETGTQSNNLEPKQRVSEPIKEKKVTQKTNIKDDGTYSIGGTVAIKIATMLSISEIRYLTVEEQKEVFNQRLDTVFNDKYYQCKTCLLYFSTMHCYHLHVASHSSMTDLEHACEICPSRFASKEGLNQHGAESHWYEYSCGLCERKHYSIKTVLLCLEGNSELDIQMQKQDIENIRDKFKITPLLPKEMSNTLKNYTEPIYVTKSKWIRKCLACNIGFNAGKPYRKHMCSHKSAIERGLRRAFTCDICHVTMSSSSLLSTHMEKWHLYKYTCKKCRCILWNKQQADCHYLRENKLMRPTGGLLKSLKEKSKALIAEKAQHVLYCNCCPYTTTAKFLCNYYVHIFTTHGYLRLNTVKQLNNEKLYCSSCKLFFNDATAFEKHFTRVGHVRRVGLICVECFEDFQTKTELVEHISSKHLEMWPDDVYPRNCCYCSLQMKYKLHEIIHVMFKHQEEYPQWRSAAAKRDDNILCDLCGKRVARNHNCQPAKPEHECRYCSYKLTHCKRVETYIQHVLSTHMERPYACALCGARFHSRHTARDHVLKIHAPVKPYTCKACNCDFSHLDFLNEHCLKTHGIDLSMIEKSLEKQTKRPVIVTYPHVKIDGSLIEKEKLEKAKLEMWDYLEEKITIPELKDVFFYDESLMMVANGPAIKNKNQGENSKDSSENGENSAKEAVVVEKSNRNENKTKDVVNSGTEIKYSNEEHLEDFSITDDEDDFKPQTLIDLEDNSQEGMDAHNIDNEVNMELDTNNEMEKEEELVGEMIEKDGEYFVIVDGMLYKLDSA